MLPLSIMRLKKERSELLHIVGLLDTHISPERVITPMYYMF